MKSLILFLLLSLNCCAFSDQNDSTNWIISSSFSITKMDFFSGMQVFRTIDNWSIGTGIEVGVNRTFFQQRIFPKIAFCGNFKFITKSWVNTYATCNYAFSLCKVNLLNNSFHYWNEIYGGMGLDFGNRFRPFFNASIGLLQESFRNNANNKILKFNTLGFQGTVGLRYVF